MSSLSGISSAISKVCRPPLAFSSFYLLSPCSGQDIGDELFIPPRNQERERERIRKSKKTVISVYFLIGPARLFTYGLCIAKLSLRSLGTRAETWTPGRIPLRQLPAALSHDHTSLVPAGALSPPPDRQFQGIGLAGLCTPVGPASDTWGGIARHLSV